MKRTIIKYQDLGDKVKILEVKNATTKQEFIEKFGEDFTLRYLSPEKVNYIFYKALLAINEHRHPYFLSVGKDITISKTHFNKMIAIMKKAGARLTRLIKEDQIKIIKI
ncbi:MAG: hypothetical protein GY841_14185 [FCB group bacterium]|nr:hypothetical protein [FCB group bacterium]